MKKNNALIFSVIYFILLIPLMAPIVSAQTVTFYPSADSFVFSREDYTDSNQGKSTAIDVGNDTTQKPTWKFYGIFKFNLSSIPAEAQINSATFKIYQQRAEEGRGSPAHVVTMITSDWNETKVTWDNKPGDSDTNISATFNTSQGYKEINMKDLVRRWVQGTHKNYGFYLKTQEGLFRKGVFQSKEGDNKPKLTIEYELVEESDSDNKTADVSAPKITNIKAQNNGVSSTKITWVTDENASSYVSSGDTSNYTQTSGQNDSVKNHEVIIKGLIPAKTYHFSVISVDTSGNEAKSSDEKFIQLPFVNQKNDENDIEDISENDSASNTKVEPTDIQPDEASNTTTKDSGDVKTNEVKTENSKDYKYPLIIGFMPILAVAIIVTAIQLIKAIKLNKKPNIIKKFTKKRKSR